MKCKKCGCEIPENVSYCPTCGTPCEQIKPTQKEEDEITCDIIIPSDKHAPSFVPSMAEPKSKTKAALLAIFLGFIGAHNFYLGYKGRGIGQLILGILIVGIPISFLWSLVEFILILTDVLKDPDGSELY